MRLRIPLLVVVGLLAATAVSAQSKPSAGKARKAPAGRDEQSLRLGLQGSYGDDSEFGIGSRLVWGLPGTRAVDLVGSFDYFFPPETAGVVTTLERKYWEANANLTYIFNVRFTPYLGTGLNLARRSATLKFLGRQTGTTTSTDMGVNVLGGLRFGSRSGRRFFAEGRWEVKGGEQLVASVGVLF